MYHRGFDERLEETEELIGVQLSGGGSVVSEHRNNHGLAIVKRALTRPGAALGMVRSLQGLKNPMSAFNTRQNRLAHPLAEVTVELEITYTLEVGPSWRGHPQGLHPDPGQNKHVQS